MPFFERVRFQGTLSGHGSTVPIGFEATINNDGALELELDRLAFSREAFDLHVDGRPATPVDLISLEGRSNAGHVFRSDSFTILHYSHGSQRGQELSYQGQCYEAELELPSEEVTEDLQSDALVWRVRQFRTFHRIARDTPLGRIVIGGPSQDQDAQHPSGFLAILRTVGTLDSQPSHDDEWWANAEELLTHLARVLSFACDTYLRPVLEERFESGRTQVRIHRLGRASSPFHPPFHELHMEPIFSFACDSFFERPELIEKLDPAIRWMTAPVAYDESRLINSMSALENILDSCGLPAIGGYMSASAFKRVASRIRVLLRGIGVPEGMMSKVLELNRPSIREKVIALLQARGIAVHDMPEGWLATVIKQRNAIVHTGVSADLGGSRGETLGYTIWVREILTRIILEQLNFEGAFRSWLHQDEQLHFPECIPMEEWVERHQATTEAS